MIHISPDIGQMYNPPLDGCSCKQASKRAACGGEMQYQYLKRLLCREASHEPLGGVLKTVQIRTGQGNCPVGGQV